MTRLTDVDVGWYLDAPSERERGRRFLLLMLRSRPEEAEHIGQRLLALELEPEPEPEAPRRCRRTARRPRRQRLGAHLPWPRECRGEFRWR